jgi:hypothetical protein
MGMAPIQGHPLRLFRVFPAKPLSNGGRILDAVAIIVRVMHARTMCRRTKRFSVEILGDLDKSVG